MITCAKSPLPSGISSINISTALSSNMLGVLLEFVKLNSLQKLGRLNKKFNRVIRNKKILPLFDELLEERKNSRKIKNARDVFCVKYSKTSYIPSLRNQLLNKYTLLQVDDFVTEIVNCLLDHFSQGVKLYLNHHSLGGNAENLTIISDALKVNETITTLDLSVNYLGVDSENLENLSDALKFNQTLTTLYLSSNYIGSNSENIQNLSDALKVNKTLTTLDLSGNNLQGNVENLKILSAALKVNKALTTLDLSNNFIGLKAENLKILLDALEVNQSLTSLNLKYNCLKKKDFKRICKLRNFTILI